MVEYKGLYRDYLYFVVFFEDYGYYRCGYVAVPENHPYYGRDCDKLPICCHGGLTFGQVCTMKYINEPEHYWIGFDCDHYGDGPDLNKLNELKIKPNYNFIHKSYPPVTLDECISNCRSIIDQLIKAEKEDVYEIS